MKLTASTPPDYHTKLWINKGTDFEFAEKQVGVKQRTALCFSGGGTRALSAAMGQMRGIEALKLMDSVDYISCVSGGSWASALFTYYKSNPAGNPGPITDADFLGPVVLPHDIIVNKPNDPKQNWLGTNDPKRLGSTASQSLVASLFLVMLKWARDYLIANNLSQWSISNWETAFEKLPYDELWIAAVGRTYFEPFGLFELYNPFNKESLADQPFYSLYADTVTEIRNRNSNTPAVKGAAFDTVRNNPDESKRPFLVINGSVIGPSKLAPFVTENPIVFEFTPLYIGSAYSPNGKPFEYQPGQSFLVGNGYVEPFAFGGDAPSQAATSCQPVEPEAKCTSVPPPPMPFTLTHASGISSSAFVSTIEQNPIAFAKSLNLGPLETFALEVAIIFLESQAGLFNLVPQSKYWPVTGEANEPTTDFSFGDGGILDNYGLLSMIRRKVKNIVVFINTSTKLDTSYDPASGPPKADQLDSNLAPLFGIPVPTAGIFTQHNQVFPKEEFAAVFNALKTAKENGKTVMTESTLTVAKNGWWGIDGIVLNSDGNPQNPKAPITPSEKVNVLWVYNERVTEWEKLLTTEKFHAKGLGDITLEEAIEAGNPTSSSDKPKGPFEYFPNYLTAGQNGDTSLVELTPKQVNLLADLSCWNITNKDGAAVFRKILGGK